MKHRALAALLAAAILMPGRALAGSYLLQANQDTWISEAFPDQVGGSDPTLPVAGTPQRKVTLMQFDVSSIPPSATVVAARLQITVTSPDPSGTPVRVYHVTNSWAEGTASWRTASGIYDTGTVHATFAPTSPGPTTVDVTSLVQQWISGTLPNEGIALATASTNETRYGSREQTQSADRPQLYIETAGATMRVASGSYVGDGTSGRVISGVGFAPNVIVVKGDNSEPSILRTSTMAGDASKELGPNSALLPNLVQSLTLDGFVVGSGFQVNDIGVTYYWTAFQSATTEMVTGTYTGDGTDNRSISGLGFQPGYLIVAAATGEDAMQRFSSEAGDASLPFKASDEQADRIQSFEVDGFQVGKHNTVNKSGVEYHYVAWKPIAGRIAGNQYNGNNSDNRDVLGVTFRPDVVILSRRENGAPSVIKTGALIGDNTLPIDGGGRFADGIQSFLPDGFQVGRDAAVNESGKTFFWVAFRDLPTVDLALTKTVDVPRPNEGDTVTYTIAVTNVSASGATGVVVTDQIPLGLSFVASTPSQGSYSPASGTWNVSGLGSGASASLAISARVDAGTHGTTLTNVAEITGSGQSDPNQTNDVADASITVQSADLQVSKTVSAAQANEGDTLAYTVVLSNAGPDTAVAVAVQDTLAYQLIYLGATSLTGTYNDTTGMWTIPMIAPANTDTLVVRAIVDIGTAQTMIANTARVIAARQADPDTANNQGSAVTYIGSAPIVANAMADTTVQVNSLPIDNYRDLNNVFFDFEDGSALAFAVENNTSPALVSVSVDADSALDLSLTPGATGSATIVVRATDSSALVVRDTFVVTVKPMVSLSLVPGSLYPTSTFVTDPQLALRIGLSNTDPVGVMLDTTSSAVFTDGTNVYQASLTSRTYIASSASNFTLTFSAAAVPPGTVAPAYYDIGLYLRGTDDDDLPYADTLRTTGIDSLYIDTPSIKVSALPLDVEFVSPGQRNVPILVLDVQNGYGTAQSLDSLDLHDLTAGTGTPAQLDGEIEALHIYDDTDATGDLSAGDVLVATSTFLSSNAVFVVSGAWSVPGAAHRSMIVTADIDSLGAKDGDRLNAAVLSPAEITFLGKARVADDFSPLYPLDSFGRLVVDGMVRFQMPLTPGAADTLLSGTSANLLMSLRCPQNGYSADTLNAIAVRNYTADFDPADLAGLQLYHDTGDGVFDPAVDTRLGTLVYSGDRFELTGLAVPVIGGVTLFIAADIATDPANGHHIRLGVPNMGVAMASSNDGPIDGTLVPAKSFAIRRVERIRISNLPLAAGAPHPGDRNVTFLRLQVENGTLQNVQLDSLSLTNRSAGAGGIPDFDRAFSDVRILVDDGNGVVDPADVVLEDSLRFSGGTLTGRNLGLPLAPGEAADLLIVSHVDSVCASDGDSLRIAVLGDPDIGFDRALSISGSFPIVTPTSRVVDGMMAHQLALAPPPDSLLVAGGTNILVFDCALPGNGYRADTLHSLEIENLGSATSDQIQRLALWWDGGNLVFDGGAGDDILIGDLAENLAKPGGHFYKIAGLSQPLPGTCGTAARLFVAADIRSNYTSGGSLQFAIPTNGVQVASGNDGPIDAPAQGPSVQVIPKPDQLTIFPYSVGDKTVFPGSKDNLNFGVGFYNGYSYAIDLQQIRLFQQGTAVSSEIDSFFLYSDTDHDGLLDPVYDTRVASVASTGSSETFNGFSLSLPPQRVSYVFASYNLRLAATDSVTIDLQLLDKSGITVSPGASDIQGEFPLNSPGVDRTNGMIAAQIDNDPVANTRVGPDDADVLAMVLTIPANGVWSDVLRYVSVENAGTARAGTDVSTVKLWKEAGGNPNGFDPGSDALLAPLTWNGGTWKNAARLSETIPLSGLRTYVTFSVASTPTDGSVFQASIPIDGIVVESGNDGPIDQAITGGAAKTISTDPLLTSLELDRTYYSVGQTVLLSMRLRNGGTDTLRAISPSPITMTGTGTASFSTGPSPALLDLIPGADSTVAWNYTAATAGTISFCGSAATADSSAVFKMSCTSPSNVQSRARPVPLALTNFAPASADRGQDNVTVMKLRLEYTDFDTLAAAIDLTDLALSIRNPAGTDLAPNSVLSRMTILSAGGLNEGFSLVDSTTNPIRLHPTNPLRIAPGATLNMNITCDIADSAAFVPFQISLAGLGDIGLQDENDDGPITMSTSQTFPWSTTPIAINEPAESLLVNSPIPSTRFANAGQEKVSILSFSLMNPGGTNSAREIVTSLSLAFFDTTGAPVAPSSVVRNIRLRSGGQLLFEKDDMPVVGNSVASDLTTPLVVPPQTPVLVDVEADLRSVPQVGAFHVALRQAPSIVARDINTGQLVAVAALAPSRLDFPLEGDRIAFQSAASGATAGFVNRLPTSILPSTAGVPVMDLVLQHPDSTSSASLIVDSLSVQFGTPGGGPVYPGDCFSAIYLVNKGDTVCTRTSLSSVSSFAPCKLTLPVTISPASAETLTVFVDTKSLFTPLDFQVAIGPQEIVILDANEGTRVFTAGAFPFVAGPARLQMPSTLVRCGLDSRIPQNVSMHTSRVAAFDATIFNDNPAGHTAVELRSLHVAVEDVRGTRLKPTDIVSAAYLSKGGVTIATGNVGTGDIAFAIPDSVLMLESGAQTTMSFIVDIGAKKSGLNFRFAIADSASTNARDALTGNPVPVGTMDGKAYPLRTSAAHVLGDDIEAAFTNYPNPFAAGRETTTITYAVKEPSRVTLELYTVWGGRVRTLLDGKLLPPGLYQDLGWDGTNGDGDTVNNGVYYLVLKIRPVAGSETTLKRKVGVVR